MTYSEALAHIHALEAFGSRPGLERVSALLSLLGDPHKKLACVHVAGTNGKGSVCKMLAEAFAAAGYKTGLTISPYVTNFRERIQVNGEMIPEAALAEYTEKTAATAAKMADGPTEFEFITALAFSYFADQGCGAVAVETGLGGRFDATNVLESPLVSVIASISLDHMTVLGNTVSQIALEKCGIIKPGAPVVSYPVQEPDAAALIAQTAKERGCELVIPDLSRLQIKEEAFTGSAFVYKDEKYTLKMAGRHQIYNATAAIEAARQAARKGFALTGARIRQGIASAQMPARLEVLSERPLILLDGAHNAGGAQALADTLSRCLRGEKLTVVIGMLRDKNYEAMLTQLAPYAKAFIAVEPDSPRALPAAALADRASRRHPDASAAPDYDAALKTAAEKSNGGPVLICGSLYLASAIRQKALDFAKSLQK